ncbi:MAG: dehydrogenase, partial [Acidobacteriota bacterium]|nr:dehydrogenase [Acidobacteriota bacterium]
MRSAAAAVAILVVGCGRSGEERLVDLETFRLHPDFRIELVAVEPQVFDPVDLAFDESGDAYVLEMPGYPLRDEAGRIVRLRDGDGDGRWEIREVFAEGFAVADSIMPYRGGLLVASPPDLLFVRDGDGDGVADERTVLLS